MKARVGRYDRLRGVVYTLPSASAFSGTRINEKKEGLGTCGSDLSSRGITIADVIKVH
jgi:hypothetical protein